MNSKFKHPCPTTAELESLAHRPTLAMWEMAELIQGFCPRARRKQSKNVQTLSNYAVPVGRMLFAIKEGDLSARAKPAEFVTWAVGCDIQLPEPFVEAVRATIFPLRRPSAPPSYNDELIRASPVSSGRSASECQEGTVSRMGSPRIAIRGYRNDICQLAREFTIEYLARHGTLPWKYLINQHVEKIQGYSLAKIDRAFSIEMLIDPKDERLAMRKFRARKRRENEEGLESHPVAEQRCQLIERE